MTNDELLAQIEHEESQAIGVSSGLLAEQRRKSLAYYMGSPYGNEVEGRSQVVTTEVKDAVEGILPALLAIFTSSDEIVKFEGQNADDEAEAQQKTDYANYVFWRQNNGFMVLYCALKDALIEKNCFSKVYWEDYEESVKETYQGLTDDEFTWLMQDDGVELIEHTALPGAQGLIHDAVFRRTKKEGKICLDPAPPEEIKVSRDCANDIKKARFVEHTTKKTISALREMGFDVADDITDDTEMEFNSERQERRNSDDTAPPEDQGLGASREVWVSEVEYKVDFDGDGLTELRKIIKVGKNILSNEEVDSGTIVTGTPIIMPHKLFGLSIADLVMDIQLIKSTVTRQLLDNSYLANNGRYEALDGMVNMDDLLTNRPGGIVRVKTLGAVKRIDSPLLGAPAFGLLEYFDQVKDQRVGVSPANFAADPNALNAKAHVAEIAQTSAMQRVELIARIFAETYLKDIFDKIIELASKHDTKAQTIKLRDKYIPVNPREWKKKFNTTITVGLGTGSLQTVQNGAMGILNIQQGMGASGLAGRVVSEQNAYHAGMEYAKTVFPRKAELFFTDPSQLPPPQPQVDPKIQLAAEKMQMQDKQKRDFKAVDYQIHQEDLQQEAGMKAADIAGQASLKGIDVAKETNMAAMQHAQERDSKGMDQVHEHTQNRLSAADQEKQIREQIAQEQKAEADKKQAEDEKKASEEKDKAEKQALDEKIQKAKEESDAKIAKLEEERKKDTEMIRGLLEKLSVKEKRKFRVVRDKSGTLIGAQEE